MTESGNRPARPAGLALGMMSGTSLDGIDAALVQTDGETATAVTAAMMNGGPLGTISSDTIVRSGWGLRNAQRK